MTLNGPLSVRYLPALSLHFLVVRDAAAAGSDFFFGQRCPPYDLARLYAALPLAWMAYPLVVRRPFCASGTSVLESR